MHTYTTKVERPWGSYESIAAASGYQVKRIAVAPGGVLSRQRHARRAEHWVVVHGLATVEVDGVERRLGHNQSVYIPLGAIHRLTNSGPVPLVLIEVQCGDYLGEDDIERLEDVYGRA
jgi:mannose-1-phosphate guanylyltransferase/mannose-6-phosphate isomerase